MPDFPTAAAFLEILTNTALEVVVRDFIFEGTPFVFRDEPELLNTLQRELANALQVVPNNIVIVGSAKIGFSLSPDNFPRNFSDESDIDVVVVDESLFDRMWRGILTWHYPRRRTGLAGAELSWMRGRRRDIYSGWFRPDKIRYGGLMFPEVLTPVRDLSTQWFNAFQALSLLPEYAHRSVSGRLYRTWDHALFYHMDGLRQIKALKQ